MDALSEVLRAVRLTGAAMLHADLGAPWAIEAAASTALAKPFLPEADSPAVFHLLVAGECTLEAGTAGPVRLRAGEVAIVAHGEAHRLANGEGAQPVALASLAKPPIAGELAPVVHGGRGERTRIITGLAAMDRRLSDPLLASLPAVLRVDLRGSPAAALLEDSLGLTLSESDAPRPGGLAMLGALAELVFIEAIGHHVESTPPGATGWLAGLNDRFVGRAMALLHGRPGEDWTVEKLARQVGISRSALAERFTMVLGDSPIAYLTGWRLALAARNLAGTHRAVEAIAKEAGYESVGSFSRAFKRVYAKPPSIWRKRSRRRA